jgi:hypothetical protein
MTRLTRNEFAARFRVLYFGITQRFSGGPMLRREFLGLLSRAALAFSVFVCVPASPR